MIVAAPADFKCKTKKTSKEFAAKPSRGWRRRLLRMTPVSRHLRWLALALCAAWALAPAQAAGQALPRAVAEALRQAGVAPSSVAVWVQPLAAREPALALNVDQPLNAASLIKLLTTYVALETLGPAYRWKTEVYSAGTLEEGTLSGHLIIKGSGDPKLTLEQFWLLLRNLRERGIRNLDGDLVLDRTAFAPGAHDPGGLRRRAAAPLQRRSRCAAGELQGGGISFRSRGRRHVDPRDRRAAPSSARGGEPGAADERPLRRLEGEDPARVRAGRSAAQGLPRAVHRQLCGGLRRARLEHRAVLASRLRRRSVPSAVGGNGRPLAGRRTRRLRAERCARASTRTNRRRSPTSCATSTSSPTTSWRGSCSSRSAPTARTARPV